MAEPGSLHGKLLRDPLGLGEGGGGRGQGTQEGSLLPSNGGKQRGRSSNYVVEIIGTTVIVI